MTAREEDDELPDSIDDREIFDILAGKEGMKEGRAGGGGGRGRWGGGAGRGGGPLRCVFLDPAHLIRSINDPEHPLTLEELNVVEQVRVKVRAPLRRACRPGLPGPPSGRPLGKRVLCCRAGLPLPPD